MVRGRVINFPTRESMRGDGKESDEIALYYNGQKVGSLFFLRDKNSSAIPQVVIDRLEHVARCWDSGT